MSSELDSLNNLATDTISVTLQDQKNQDGSLLSEPSVPGEPATSHDPLDDDSEDELCSQTSKPQRPINIGNLPPELLKTFIQHLPLDDVLELSVVNRLFRSLIQGESQIWKSLYTKEFPCFGPQNSFGQPVPLRFAPLTGSDSWREELRARVNLTRFARHTDYFPLFHADGNPRRARGLASNPGFAYLTKLSKPVTNLIANYKAGPSGTSVRLLFGSAMNGQVRVDQDERSGATLPWYAPKHASFRQIEQAFEAENPEGRQNYYSLNPLDVSFKYGSVYCGGFSGGEIEHGYNDQDLESRRILSVDLPFMSDRVHASSLGYSAVWLAKEYTIPAHTDSQIVCLVGSRAGTVHAWAEDTSIASPPGHSNLSRNSSFSWVLSPGVPIISIQVDELNKGQRTWATALNALGEVFYLEGKPVNSNLYEDSWDAGSDFPWKMIDESRRKFESPEKELKWKAEEKSYVERCRGKKFFKPGETWTGACMRKAASYWQDMFLNWDTRASLISDFSAGSRYGLGESVIVIPLRLSDERCPVRYQRNRESDVDADRWTVTKFMPMTEVNRIRTCCAFDNSQHVTVRKERRSMVSSRLSEHIIGHSRLFAVGLDDSRVILWDARAGFQRNTKTIMPWRVIQLSSYVTAVALNSFYLVSSSGERGQVEFWDLFDKYPGDGKPFKTYDICFEQRHLPYRRVPESLRGYPNFWVQEISLDPNSTNLRGSLSFLDAIFYWSFGSLALKENYVPAKMHGMKGLWRATHVPKYSTPRAEINEIIQEEREQMDYEEQSLERLTRRMENRFGVGMIEDEEDMLRYAEIISQETYEQAGVDPDLEAALLASLEGHEGEPVSEEEADEDSRYVRDLEEAIRQSMAG